MTKQEYDKHISVMAEFLAQFAVNSKVAPDDIRKECEQVWQSLGKAYMALRRERMYKYGDEEDEVHNEH